MSEPSADRRIWLRDSTKKKLRAFKNRLQDWSPDDLVVDKLIDIAEIGTLNVGYLEQELNIVNIEKSLARPFIQLGAVLGFKGETYFDFGLTSVQRAKIVTFFEDTNPTTVRIRLAMGALQELVREDHLDLGDILEEFVTRIRMLTVAGNQNEEDTDEETENQ